MKFTVISVIIYLFYQLTLSKTALLVSNSKVTLVPGRYLFTMAKNSPTHQVGDLINLRYEVVGILGRGGMSSVYKVKDQNLDGQLIALKLLDPILLRDVTNIERFKREAIIARKLDHPNIVRVYDFDVTEGGEYFLTMEYIDGSTLSDRLKNTSAPLTIAQLTVVLYEIASALENAHKHGVVHRDLKPANVLLTKEGKVKIADFGLCRASCFDSALSSSGECLGTPAYMSPEQIRGENIDGRSDIYSLGMLAFEACEGAPPFKADTWFKVAEMHLRSPMPKLSTEFPEWYREMVARCAAKVPDQRYDSAQQLLELLEEHLAHTTTTKRSGSFGHYVTGALGASCVLFLCATIGIVGARFITKAPPTPKPVSMALGGQKNFNSEQSPNGVERKQLFNSPMQAQSEEQEKFGMMAKLRQLDERRDHRESDGFRDFRGQSEMREEGPQRERHDTREMRDDAGPKQARFICTRAGRTIESDSIPEGKNWECTRSNQLFQPQMNQNGGNDPKFGQGNNNRQNPPMRRGMTR